MLVYHSDILSDNTTTKHEMKGQTEHMRGTATTVCERKFPYEKMLIPLIDGDYQINWRRDGVCQDKKLESGGGSQAKSTQRTSGGKSTGT
jgi:hypothetical protein